MQESIQQTSLAIVAATASDDAAAADMVRRLDLPLLPTGTDPQYCDQVAAVLLVEGLQLCLQQAGKGAPGPVAVEFGSAAMRHRRRSGSNELLGRAVGVGKKSPLQVLDATAGLGRDGFVLADLGCDVTLCEREPVVLELLRAGIAAATAEDDPWLAGVMQRMRLSTGDARQTKPPELLGTDVIYLDPMFPQRDKSAAVKKDMALLQLLFDGMAGGQDADDLLLWAMQQDVARVVVKRPARAPNLALQAPSHCISGKAVRYDVYVRHKLT